MKAHIAGGSLPLAVNTRAGRRVVRAAGARPFRGIMSVDVCFSVVTAKLSVLQPSGRAVVFRSRGRATHQSATVYGWRESRDEGCADSYLRRGWPQIS